MCHLQFLYWNYLFHVAYVKIDYFFLSYLLVSLHKCYFVSIFHLVTFQISRNFWFTLFCSSLFFSTVNNYFWTCKTYGLLYLPQNDCWQFESHPATKVHVKKYLQFVGPFSRCTFYLSHLLFSCLSCWCLSKKKKSEVCEWVLWNLLLQMISWTWKQSENVFGAKLHYILNVTAGFRSCVFAMPVSIITSVISTSYSGNGFEHGIIWFAQRWGVMLQGW